LVATEEAHALHREAADIFERLSSLQQTARNLKSSGGGHVRLAVVPSLGLSVTPRAIARFRNVEPNVTFEVQTLHHDELVRALHERKCDFAIAYDPPSNPRLTIRPIASGELAILFRAGSLAAPGERLPLDILHGRDLVGLTASGPIGELFTGAVERLGISFRETISVQTFYIAAALVQFGAGISVVDEFTARARLSDALDYRFLEPPLRFSVCCVSLENSRMSGVAERFVQSFKRELSTGDEPAGP